MALSLDRKSFLTLGAQRLASALALGIAPGLIRSAWAAAGNSVVHGSHDLFVLVFLRGGADALNFVPPISGMDREIYESARPNLKIPISGEKSLLRLDSRFGIHPSAKPFHDLYHAGHLALVHASGLTADSRSHFDAQAYVELGTPKSKNTQSGWLARHLKSRGLGKDAFGAVAVGSLLPTSLLAFEDAAVINGLGGFNLGGRGNYRGDEYDALRRMYAPAMGEGDWLEGYGSETLDALHRIENQPAPDTTGDYPKAEIGNRLKTLAQLVRMNLGLEVATVDMGGWDTHKYQGKGAEGHFGNQVQQLSQAVAAFYGEMQSLKQPVTILIQTEFGRRLKENANQGTDHGHGGVMFVLGDKIKGGKVYGEWPGLKTEHLYERADLAVTTDYRQVVSEILSRRQGERKLGTVFPGYAGYKPLGLVR